MALVALAGFAMGVCLEGSGASFWVEEDWVTLWRFGGGTGSIGSASGVAGSGLFIARSMMLRLSRASRVRLKFW